MADWNDLKRAFERDLEKAFIAFANDPLVTIDSKSARKLFNEMSTSNVKYHDVDSYQNLLNIMASL